MSTSTPINAFTVPALGDIPNIETATAAISQIDPKVTSVFSTATARNNAITSPTEGMLSYVTGDDILYIYDGTNWFPVPRTDTGSQTVSFTSQTSFTVAVNFSLTFPGVPTVHTNINSAAGATASWHSRAFSVTSTGFTLFLFGPSATWTSYGVQWTATWA